MISTLDILNKKGKRNLFDSIGGKFENRVKRDKFQYNLDRHLDSNQALVPLINSYIEGPALRDERRNRAIMHKAVATQE